MFFNVTAKERYVTMTVFRRADVALSYPW